MRTVLSFHDDFQNEKTLMEQLIIERGHKHLFIPKFHCELNPVKRVWGQVKVYLHFYTNFCCLALGRLSIPHWTWC